MIRRAVLVALPPAVALATPALSQGILEALIEAHVDPRSRAEQKVTNKNIRTIAALVSPAAAATSA
jgi:hypothetical protein